MAIANINEMFGILNASDIRIFNKSTGALLLKFPQGNSVVLDIKADTKTATAQGIDVITWGLPKSGTLKFTAETISFPQLAETLGSNGMKLNSSAQAFDTTETFTVTTDGTITINLKKAPFASSVTNFHSLAREGSLNKTLTAIVDASDAKKFTITDSSLAVGDIVEVNYMATIPTNGVYTFKVAGSGSTTPSRRLVARVLVTNYYDNSMDLMTLDIPNVKFENSLSLTFDASNPSKFEVTIKIMGDARLKDDDGNPLFLSLSALNGSASAISDLAGTSSVAGKVALTFTAPTGATTVDLQYKLSSGSTWASVATSGTSGIYISGALTSASTATTVNGLTTTSAYDFRLVVTDGDYEGTSNVISVTP